VQLCDSLEPNQYGKLRDRMPGIRLVQVIHVEDESSLWQAIEVAPRVDALLLDSGRPNQPVKELGGTGRVHDWSISRRIRETVDVPVYLAGGLKPENVRDAIDIVGPFALDICSGVRTDGKLDPRKLELFFQHVQRSMS
jgi:phosphoribosylanthranilate isomerase